MKRLSGKFGAALLGAALVFGGCSGGSSGGAIIDDGDGGSGGDPETYPFLVTGSWVNLVPSCNGGPVDTGDDVSMAFPSDAIALGMADGSCHAVFTGEGVVTIPRTEATVEDATMTLDIDLGLADCADAAEFTNEALLAAYYEMDVLAEDGVYPFECYGYRHQFGPVEFGVPVPILFECPHLDSGCPSLIVDGGLAADFDIVAAIQEAAAD